MKLRHVKQKWLDPVVENGVKEQKLRKDLGALKQQQKPISSHPRLK